MQACCAQSVALLANPQGAFQINSYGVCRTVTLLCGGQKSLHNISNTLFMLGVPRWECVLLFDCADITAQQLLHISLALMTWWQHAARYHHDRRSSNCAVILMLQNSPARGTLHATSLPQTAVLGPQTVSIMVPTATRFMPQSSQFKIRTFTAIT